MTTITIPKKLVSHGELVLIPRKEYEELLRFKRIQTFRPTVSQKHALAKARRDFQKGKCLTLIEFHRALGGRRPS